MHVSILDLGSNSFQWIVAQTDGYRVWVRHQRKRFVRLANSMVAGALDAEGLERALRAVSELMDALPAGFRDLPIIAVATGAIRQANNGAQLLRAVEMATGIRVQTISGEREAQLSYLGASSDHPELFAQSAGGAVAVLDLGGGSLELALGQGVHATRSHSTPRGLLTASLRAARQGAAGRNRWLALEEAAQWVVAGLVQSSGAEALPARRWIAACGVAREIHALCGRMQWLPMPDGPLTPVLLDAHWREWSTWEPERLAALGVSADRCATLPLAAAIFAALCRRLGVSELAVSRGGLRHGLALDHYWKRASIGREYAAAVTPARGGASWREAAALSGLTRERGADVQ